MSEPNVDEMEPEKGPGAAISTENEGPNTQRMVLSSAKLQMLNLALCIGLFLAVLDSTIVSTALVLITDSLHGFDQASWIINAYLLTYTGFLVITARLSDILGRRAVLSGSMIIFILASIACGVAQTLTQLIVFRAFQGVGGAGMTTLVFVMLPEMCTVEQYPLYSSIVSSISVFSGLLGPVFGGVISEKSTWRWIFYLNIPLGAVALASLHLSTPAHFPYATTADAPKISKDSYRKLDFVGTGFMLIATTLLLTALEESSIGRSWASAVVVAPLVIGLLFWGVFVGWSKYLSSLSDRQEPILPWRVLADRFCLALFFSAFWTGGTVYSTVFALPQRFQVVHGTSPFLAGVRLLPLTLGVPVGSAVSATLITKKHTPPFYFILAGSAIQTLGVGLIITLPTDAGPFPNSGYGFEAITGFGIGLSTASAILTAIITCTGGEQAVVIGALGQFRALGGSIGVSVCTNVMNSYTSSQLSSTLSQAQMAAIRLSAKAIDSFPEAARSSVRDSYAHGFRRQGYAMTGFAAVGVLTVLLMWEKKLRRQV